MSEQQAQGTDAVVDLNNELKSRREKLAALREQGIPFPNDFRRDRTSDQLHADFDAKENEELEALNIEVSVAGRMMTRRIMGKASFVTLQDVGGRIQLYVSRDDLPEGIYNEQFKKWDLGERHLKVMVEPVGGGPLLDGIAFNVDTAIWPDNGVREVEIAYKLDINEFRGNRSLQIIIDNIWPI